MLKDFIPFQIFLKISGHVGVQYERMVAFPCVLLELSPLNQL